MKHFFIFGLCLLAATIAAIKLQSNHHPITDGQANHMNYTIVSKPAFDFVGIKIKTDNNRCMEDIPALWQKFMAENIAAQIPHKIDHDLLALYTDYEGDYTKPYTYFIGCRVSKVEQLPPFLSSKHIPTTNYALFIAKGAHPQAVGKLWMDIWKSDLKRAYKADFELYDARFFSNEPSKEVALYIGI